MNSSILYAFKSVNGELMTKKLLLSKTKLFSGNISFFSNLLNNKQSNDTWYHYGNNATNFPPLCHCSKDHKNPIDHYGQNCQILANNHNYFFADTDFWLQMTKAKYFKYLMQLEPILTDLGAKNSSRYLDKIKHKWPLCIVMIRQHIHTTQLCQIIGGMRVLIHPVRN
jgi:hypothetical protein